MTLLGRTKRSYHLHLAACRQLYRVRYIRMPELLEISDEAIAEANASADL